jgi:dihydrofolate reductase
MHRRLREHFGGQQVQRAGGAAELAAAYGEGFDLLLGRRTNDLWSGFWPKAPSSPMADRLNGATKYIATHRPESLDARHFVSMRASDC